MMIKNKNLWDEIYLFLDKKYPERWDVTTDPDSIDQGILIIHYPEIEMTNTAGKKHIITDLFVRLRLIDRDDYRVLQNSFYGMRMSASEGELIGKYRHSHLPSSYPKSFNNFSSFCTGSGPIHQHLQKCMYASFNLIDFKLLMMNIDTYVAYESTNTNPYMRFAYLTGSHSATNVFFNLSQVKKYVSEMDNLDQIKVFCRNKTAQVKNFSKEAYSKPLSEVFRRGHLVSKSSDGRYWTLSEGLYRLERNREEVLSQSYVFKGKEIKFKITN